MFFLLGSKKKEDELTAGDRELIQAHITQFRDSRDAIVERVGRGVSVLGTIERLVSFAMRLYWQAFIAYADGEAEYEWVLGDTEHCETCLGLSGVVQTGDEWREVAEEQGIYPRSPNLACTGVHCGCRLVKV